MSGFDPGFLVFSVYLEIFSVEVCVVRKSWIPPRLITPEPLRLFFMDLYLLSNKTWGMLRNV